ncbi:MAG: FG-GAP-like repeat-containing protein [Planctomycetota bacterium]
MKSIKSKPRPLIIVLLLFPCLSRAADPPVDKLIQDLTEGDTRTRALARRLLPRLGAEAVDAVIPLLTNKSKYTTKAAFDILMDIGNQASGPGRKAERKLVTDKYMSLIHPARSEKERIIGLRLLEKLVPPGYDVKPIADMLEEKPMLRNKARTALQRIATKEARLALRNALTRADPEFQCALLNSLSELKDRPSLDTIKNLTESQNAQVRASAARAMAWTGDPDYLKLTKAVIASADEATRFQAKDALLRLTEAMAEKGGNWQMAINSYLDILQTYDGVFKDAALAGLARFGDGTCVDPILSAIKDAHTRTWLVGIDALNRMQGVDVTRQIAKAHPNLPAETRLKLIPALANKDFPDAAGILEGQTKSDRAALQTLSQVGQLLKFERVKLGNVIYEAASAFDVNNDGSIDIISGEYWFEGPEYTRQHKICDIARVNVDYYDDFCDYPMDVDGDGYTDIVTGGWWNQNLQWRENPKGRPVTWKTHDILKVGHVETIRCWDVDGDGHVEIVPNAGGHVSIFKLVRDKSGKGTGKFKRHVAKGTKVGHGLGFGDLNGDGRGDFIIYNGWLEAPPKPLSQEWTFHPEFQLGVASVPILVHDLNHDGRADLIVGMAHNYGLQWWEQKVDGAGKRTWTKHDIETDRSQYHDLMLADIDNDNQPELITGKRYRGHNGHDPGANDPVGLYYFEIYGDQFKRVTIDYGPPTKASGVGLYFWVADVDANGWQDIIAPGKEGLYLFRNHGPITR